MKNILTLFIMIWLGIKYIGLPKNITNLVNVNVTKDIR